MALGRKLATATRKRVPPVPMPGPHAPEMRDGPGVLGPDAAAQGAYFLPGLGEWARARNRRRYRERHAFNPGPGGTDRS